MAIITSLIDSDLYKLSQQQAVFHQYPKTVGRYELAVRTLKPAFPLTDIVDQIREEIMSFESLKLSNDEYVFLQSMPWFKKDYLDWLSEFRFNPSIEVKIETTKNGGITVSPRGLWHHEILYEVPILAVIEELYCARASRLTPDQAEVEAINKLSRKVAMLRQHPRLTFTDFGTRRRFSKRVHGAVLKYLEAKCPNIIGTSNVNFARQLGFKAIGTMSHEFLMGHLALVDRLDQAQKRALHVWQQEYGDNLGTALTDTFTTGAFWRDFDVILAKGFSSVRQDSGDPFDFGRTAIEHYKHLGIDPRTKSIIFSDSLNFPKMIELFEAFTGLIGVSFGIGTDLSNSVDIEPLSIVIKLMELNGIPLVKLSDAVGKTMGDQEMVRKVKVAYGVEP